VAGFRSLGIPDRRQDPRCLGFRGNGDRRCRLGAGGKERQRSEQESSRKKALQWHFQIPEKPELS
jgi:hypothetical protein